MIRAEEYMSEPIVTVGQKDTVQEAADVMNQKNIGSLIIMESNKVVGILTERDIVRRVIHKKQDINTTLVADVMTKDILTAHRDATMLEISNLMKENTVRRIIIVDDNEEPLGIVTSRDIIGLLI